MIWLLLLTVGPFVLGALLATLSWMVRGRSRRSADPGWGVLAAGAVLVLGGLAMQLMAGPVSLPLDLPIDAWQWYSEIQFAIPLLLGVAALVLAAFPVENRKGTGSADLAPRTAMSFVRGRWLVAPALVLAILLVATVTAGVASRPDATTGRYTAYFVSLGGERSMGTSIYGWFYSVPCLVLVGLLLAIATLDLFLISRPALDHDRDRDVNARTSRARNVIFIGTGALLVHLGLVLTSLAGASSLQSQLSTLEGDVTVWTSFAALQPLLRIASYASAAIGFALWSAVALSATPSRRRMPAAAGA
ncbi:hypothetical protein C5E16_01660 [Clavibacter michiganensis]|uniref:Uncharacterized protein n=1 Tax=Clavibacter michiganensis TaxID=28447 RepID=A0A2S5VXH2_9MICO|nr:hypothetical protein [Clavibacter michiganensis]PPF70981.1 hypothetical protein C5E16_01660 [Clavibacter michiganensis]